jgi:hypothetical protein
VLYRAEAERGKREAEDGEERIRMERRRALRRMESTSAVVSSAVEAEEAGEVSEAAERSREASSAAGALVDGSADVAVDGPLLAGGGVCFEGDTEDGRGEDAC